MTAGNPILTLKALLDAARQHVKAEWTATGAELRPGQAVKLYIVVTAGETAYWMSSDDHVIAQGFYSADPEPGAVGK